MEKLAVDAFKRRRELEAQLAKHQQTEKALQREIETIGPAPRRDELETQLVQNKQAQAQVRQELKDSRDQLQAQRENQERWERDHGAAPYSATTPQQIEKQQDQEDRSARIPPGTPQPSPNSNTNSPSPSVSLALIVGGVRGADGGPTQTLVIPHDTTQAQILLSLKDDSYPRYRVSLRKIGGPEIFSETNIRPRSTKAGSRFVFTIPARQLTSGEYALTLSGVTPEGGFDDLSKSLFRVEKH